MELYEDVLQNSLHLISQFNWLGAYCSAAIIMIFVSCSNIYGYLQNYQDCLTLDATLHYSTLLYATPRYSTLLYTTLRYATICYSTLRYSTLR
jgi:hypothetical protein